MEKDHLFQCYKCRKSFTRKYTLKRHIDRAHPLPRKYKCNHCQFIAHREDTLDSHIEKKHSKSGIIENENVSYQKSIDGEIEDIVIIPEDVNQGNVLAFFSNQRENVEIYLDNLIERKGAIKWYMSVQLELQKENEDEVVRTTPHFNSLTKTLFPSSEEIIQDIDKGFQKVHESMLKYTKEHSGWNIERILTLKIHTAKYVPLGGSNYIPLPSTLEKMKAILNIRNDDNMCFMWSILAHLHPVKSHGYISTSYSEYVNELDFTNISFPVTLKSIKNFENLNSISVNVFGYENDCINPLYLSKMKSFKTKVNLLMLEDENNSHYCLIQDLNKFLSRTKSHKGKHFFCPFCLKGLGNENLYEEHFALCESDGQRIKMPLKGEKMKFNNPNALNKCQFVLYADFETFVKPFDTCTPHPNASFSNKLDRYDIASYCYQLVSIVKDKYYPPVLYRGPDAGMHFLKSIFQLEKEIVELKKGNKTLEMSDEDKVSFQKTKKCIGCGNCFDKFLKKNRDHNHLLGTFNRAFCTKCNLKASHSKEPNLVIVFHNLKNFDGHIIIDSLQYFPERKINVIPQTFEKYLSFDIDGKIRFIDSYNFLNDSLSNLIENLKQSGEDKFVFTRKVFTDDTKFKAVLRKGVFPYAHLSSLDVFEETELPNFDGFYNKLLETDISSDDYEWAQYIWKLFDMKNFGTFHDVYLYSDCLLLTDVMEEFRKISHHNYSLDPFRFVSLPAFVWPAMMLYTGVEIELISDIDMHDFIEGSIRGGYCCAFTRYAKSNNRYLKDFDPSLPSSFISYLDCNNLYGFSMCEKLPISDYEFLSDTQVKDFDLELLEADESIGYILEIDVIFPEETHNDLDFPPLAENRRVECFEFLPYSRDTIPFSNPVNSTKLINDLYPKQNYVIHYKNLLQILDLGAKVVRINRILKFKQFTAKVSNPLESIRMLDS